MSPAQTTLQGIGALLHFLPGTVFLIGIYKFLRAAYQLFREPFETVRIRRIVKHLLISAFLIAVPALLPVAIEILNSDVAKDVGNLFVSAIVDFKKSYGEIGFYGAATILGCATFIILLALWDLVYTEVTTISRQRRFNMTVLCGAVIFVLPWVFRAISHNQVL
jgi:hypothetical protein